MAKRNFYMVHIDLKLCQCNMKTSAMRLLQPVAYRSVDQRNQTIKKNKLIAWNRSQQETFK